MWYGCLQAVDVFDGQPGYLWDGVSRQAKAFHLCLSSRFMAQSKRMYLLSSIKSSRLFCKYNHSCPIRKAITGYFYHLVFFMALTLAFWMTRERLCLFRRYTQVFFGKLQAHSYTGCMVTGTPLISISSCSWSVNKSKLLHFVCLCAISNPLISLFLVFSLEMS